MTALGLVALAVAAPASAAVRPGNTVMAFPASDMVVAEGNYSGTMTIRVLREVTPGGALAEVGSATGPAQELLPGVFGLEVNHGIATQFRRPGDCWGPADQAAGGIAPNVDVRAGDTIQVTDGNPGMDDMVVTELTIEDPFIDDDQSSPTFEQLVVEGTAPGLSVTEIESGVAAEFRHRPDGAGDFRRDIPVVVPDIAEPTRWRAVFTDVVGTDRQHALHAEWAVTFGHTPPQPQGTVVERAAPGEVLGGPTPLGCNPLAPPPPPPPVFTPFVPAVQEQAPPVVVTAAPILRTLRVPAAITRAGLRGKGLKIHVRADRGARVVKLKVIRLRARKPAVLVRVLTRALPESGMAFITLGPKILGGAPGTYVIEGTAGTRLATLGGTKRASFRINR